jgi:hypothetical protein
MPGQAEPRQSPIISKPFHAFSGVCLASREQVFTL